MSVLPNPQANDAEPAQILAIELETRIATQRLHYRSGDEETAVDSLYKLFLKTRELLATRLKTAAFEPAAVFLLNQIMRPYTARWHRWMVDKKFVDERSRRQFRYELQQLQDELQDFLAVIKLIAREKQEAVALFAALQESIPDVESREAKLGGLVQAGFALEVKPKCGDLHESLKKDNRPRSFLTADDIDRLERSAINERRFRLAAEKKSAREEAQKNAVAKTEPAPVLDAPIQNASGLCLSGGGIRSATFCLGIVQELVRQRLFEQFDYLSTVSGGGYLGTFLTSYLGSSLQKTSPIHDIIEAAFTAKGGSESPALRHLRNNSRYLISGGLWARLKILGLLLTGIATNIFLMLPLPLVAVLIVWGLWQAGYWQPNWIRTPAYTFFAALGAIFALGWFFLPLVRNIARGAKHDSPQAALRSFWEATCVIIGIFVLFFGCLVAVPKLLKGATAIRIGTAFEGPLALIRQILSSEKLLGLIIMLAPVVFGLFAFKSKAGSRSKKWMTFLFALSGPLLLFAVFLIVANRSVWPQPIWSIAWVAGVTVGLILWAWFFVDLNEFSPHRYYRNRLCECYLAVPGGSERGKVRRFLRWLVHGRKKKDKSEKCAAEKPNKPAQPAPAGPPADASSAPTDLPRPAVSPIPPADPPTVSADGSAPVGVLRHLPLTEINRSGAAPYHLLNCAVNLPASLEPNLRGRASDFYTFTRHYCGGPVCGYIDTETLEKLDPNMDLGTAMAVSAAAASSNMGVKTLRHFRFLMTLLNIRLGYWLRNPTAGLRSWWNGPGPRYLFREMMGWMHERTPYVNLSDGGHIENLALYEMLRRRCKFIVVVDGAMEPGMEGADLMLAQRYAEIDLGVRFEIDLADLALDTSRRSRAYAVFGKIYYSPRDDAAKSGAGDMGWLVYFHLARTGGEPGYVSDYARQNPEFPHQTTGDQIYDEAQFEAYRRLGECAAESLFRPEISAPYQAAPVETRAAGAKPRFESLEDWFKALANSLLADNDPAFGPRRKKSAKTNSAPTVQHQP